MPKFEYINNKGEAASPPENLPVEEEDKQGEKKMSKRQTEKLLRRADKVQKDIDKYKDVLNEELDKFSEELKGQGKGEEDIEKIRKGIVELFYGNILPQIETGSRLEGIGKLWQNEAQEVQEFLNGQFLSFEKMAGWQRVLDSADELKEKQGQRRQDAGAVERASSKPQEKEKPVIAGQKAEEDKQQSSSPKEIVKSNREFLLFADGKEAENEQESQSQEQGGLLLFEKGQGEQKREAGGFWLERRNQRDEQMADGLLKKYSEKFKVSKESRDIILNALSAELGAEAKAVIEARNNRLKEWFDASRDLLETKGIINKNIEVKDNKKAELALQAGASKEVFEQSEYDNIDKLDALQIALNQDNIPLSRRRLALDFLIKRIDSLVSLESLSPEQEKALDLMEKASQELVEKITGRDLNEEINISAELVEETKENVIKYSGGYDEKKGYDSANRSNVIFRKVYEEAWKKLGPEKQKEYSGIDGFTHGEAIRIDCIIGAKWIKKSLDNFDTSRIDDRSPEFWVLLALAKQGYDIEKTEKTSFFRKNRKKTIKLFKGSAEKQVSYEELEKIVIEGKQAIEKEVNESLSKQWDEIVKKAEQEAKQEILMKKIKDAIPLVQEEIDRDFEELKQGIETEYVLKELAEVKPKTSRELTKISKAFGEKGVDAIKVMSDIMHQQGEWAELSEDSAPDKIADIFSNYFEGMGVFGNPGEIATDRRRNSFYKKAKNVFGREGTVASYQAAFRGSSIGFADYFINSISSIFEPRSR